MGTLGLNTDAWLQRRGGWPLHARALLRQADSGGLTAHPDFWSGLLWKRLMGPRVMVSTRVMRRVYPVCIPGDRRHIPGGPDAQVQYSWPVM